MKKQIRVAFSLFALVVIGSLSADASACSCLGEPPPCAAFSGASAVFLGKVIDAAEQKEETSEDGTKTVYDVGAIRFSVIEAFSGAIKREVVIHSGTGGADCGYWFERNKVYLVYAYGEPGRLSTNICSRTRAVEEANEDLVFLRHLPPRGSGGTLHGTVERYAGDMEHGPSTLVGPVAGIKVIIESAKRRFETTTDQAGQYQMKLPPGSYDVRLILPDQLVAIFQRDTGDQHGSYSGHEKLEVTDRGCTRNNISVWLDGRIGGRIIDAEGKPVKEMKVDLVNADSPEKSWSAWSDADGRYEFRTVQPGLYLLGLNIDRVPTAQYPYPRTYYPGVGEQAQARGVVIGEGTKLTNYDLTLPPRLKDRAIEGAVVWPDGRPAVGARVMFYLSEYPGRSLPEHAATDGNGRFSITLFQGQVYRLWAMMDKHHSETIELTPTDKTEPMKMVLARADNSWLNELKRSVKRDKGKDN